MNCVSPSTPSAACGLCCTNRVWSKYLVARLTSPALMPANTAKTFSISLFAIGSSPNRRFSKNVKVRSYIAARSVSVGPRASDLAYATVGHEIRTGQVRTLVRPQEDRRVGDLLG